MSGLIDERAAFLKAFHSVCDDLTAQGGEAPSAAAIGVLVAESQFRAMYQKAAERTQAGQEELFAREAVWAARKLILRCLMTQAKMTPALVPLP